jgi:hypothetical protein
MKALPIFTPDALKKVNIPFHFRREVLSYPIAVEGNSEAVPLSSS